MARLEAAIASAAAAFGDVEVLDARVALARYLGDIGDAPRATAAYAAMTAAGAHVSTGQRVDIAMSRARLALAQGDWHAAKALIAEGKACVAAGRARAGV